MKKQEAVVKAIIEKGVNIKSKYFTQPIIHSAAENGWIDIIELLIEKGADIHEKGWHNNTALYYAIVNGHCDVVEFILSKGGDVNATWWKWSLLDQAKRNKHDNVATLLRRHGAKTFKELKATER